MTDEFKKARDEKASDYQSVSDDVSAGQGGYVERAYIDGWDACSDEILNSAEMKAIFERMETFANMPEGYNSKDTRARIAAFKARFNVGVGDKGE